MIPLHKPNLVSVHGGHSGEFCCHAKDTLEEIIKAYIKRGFSWVGITEHMPFSSNELFYPEEKEAGFDVQETYRRFAGYISKCRKLQKNAQNPPTAMPRVRKSQDILDQKVAV